MLEASAFTELVVEFEAPFGRLLMTRWSLPSDVQGGASDWRRYRESPHSDLAATVNAANLLATHTLSPHLFAEERVVDSPVFEQLGVFPANRRALIAKRDQVRSLAGL